MSLNTHSGLSSFTIAVALADKCNHLIDGAGSPPFAKIHTGDSGNGNSIKNNATVAE